MKSGELYEVRHKWALPMSRFDFWSKVEYIFYVGEESIHRDDGTIVVNHIVLAGGKRVVLDETFLRFLEPVDESR